MGTVHPLKLSKCLCCFMEESSYIKNGVLSYPAPLQLQCMLYIVGHIDEVPFYILALLPHHIRHELLLMLPVVDVCKLEETPVTIDLPMDNLWKACMDRLPDHILCRLTTPDQAKTEYGIDLTWKECYFQEILKLYSIYPTSVPPLLFSVFSNSVSVFNCFSSMTQGCHGLLPYCFETYTGYIPIRYYHFFDVNTPLTDVDLLKTLTVDCWIFMRIIDIKDFYLFIRKRHIPTLFPFLTKLYSLVEVINYKSGDFTVLKPLFDDIFFSSSCQVKVVKIGRPDIIAPYLAGSTQCQLKEVHFTERFAKASYYPIASSILECQLELEKVKVQSIVLDKLSDMSMFLQSLLSLFSKPLFKQLSLDRCEMSSSVLMDILHNFLTSPYQVNLKLFHVEIKQSQFSKLLLSNTELQHTKDLCVSECVLGSCLPSNLHLNSLYLKGASVMESFSQLQSITTNILELETSMKSVDGLHNLLQITTTQECHVILKIEYDNPDILVTIANALSALKGNVTKLLIILYSWTTLPSRQLLDTLFSCFQPYLPVLELKLVCPSFNDKNIDEILDIWHCHVKPSLKLKKIDIHCTNFSDKDFVMNVLSEIADEIVI